MLVVEVNQGTPAEKAGIEPGDIIVAWNGQRATDYTDLMLAISHTDVGAKVPVKLFRNGQEITLQVEVAELPPPVR